MRIAILSLTEGDGHGAERILSELMQSWKGLKHELIILATKNSKICKSAEQIGLITVALDLKNNFLSTFIELKQLVKVFPDFDIIHGWTARTFEWAWYIAKKRGIPFTCTLHDHPQSNLHKIHRHWMMREIANRSASLVCVSKALEDACIKYKYSANIKVIQNGLIDTANTNKCKYEIPRIGFLGLYAKWKGFSIIKQWIEYLIDERVEWFLYGDICSDLEPEIRSISTRFPNKVIIKGRQIPQSIFNEIDILLNPSIQFDPFPTVLIEAAMSAIPSIASNRGGASEIIIHGKTGYIFNPDQPKSGLDHLRFLIQNPNIANQMGISARSRFENYFSVNKMVELYYTLWEKVHSSV
jgi:glycosyltransferase involved in cell wall biosynthesis